MASTITEITGGSGSFAMPGTESYERVFEIYYDTPQFNATEVLADPRLPQAQEPYAQGSSAVHLSRSARQNNNRGAPHHWTVTCSYSTQVSSNQAQPQFNQDPEVQAPRISWSTNAIQVTLENDRRGKKKCNSAGDLFRPGKAHYESVRICTIRYFVRQKPAGLLSLHNCINKTAFTVDGEQVEQHCARVADVQVGEERYERGVRGRDIMVQIEIGPSMLLPNASDVKDVGATSTVQANKRLGYWIANTLDRGRQVLGPLGAGPDVLQTYYGPDGVEPAEPIHLDGKGKALPTPVKDGDEVYRYWYDYREVEFTDIRFV
ncbi:MAG: hypothetical protein ACK6D3_24255 [Planctomycetaceae bacterium]|jgi:hypothetical protein